MFCSNCGAENKDSAKFCKECGAAINKTVKKGETKPETKPETKAETIKDEASEMTPEATSVKIPEVAPETLSEIDSEKISEPSDDAPQTQKSNKSKGLSKKAVVGIGLAVIALLAVFFISKNLGSTVNMNDYLTIETEGYDGYGIADVVIDWDGIEADYGEKLAFTKQASEDYAGLLAFMTPIDFLEECVDVVIDEKRGLSNGDEIVYFWDINEAVFEYVNIKLKSSDDSVIVSGLGALETFDAFENLKVSYEGIAPYGRLKLEYSGEYLDSYDFDSETYDGLSNGDTVEVFIFDDLLEYNANLYGVIPEQITKSYTVEGLDTLLEGADEISSDLLSEMKQQAEDVYQANVAKTWADSSTLENLTYLGTYFLKTKDTADVYSGENELYLIYKARVRDAYSNNGKSFDETFDIYWYTNYSQLLVDGEGNIDVSLTDCRTPMNRVTIDSNISDGWFSTKSWYYYGYASLDDLYKDVVTSNIDLFTCEDRVEDTDALTDVNNTGMGESPEDSETTELTDGTYLLAQSNVVLIDEDDLSGFTADECQLAINEIYARHDRLFNNEEIQAYFDTCSWYEGVIQPEDFDESLLSETERANVAFILAYEEEKGFR